MLKSRKKFRTFHKQDHQPEPQPLRLNLGCGKQRIDGFVGVDCVKTDAVDIVHDLETYPYPFDNDSVDEIVISHFVEHVHDLMSFFNELYRILKPGAKCTVVSPYYTSIRAVQDPTHVRGICETTFIYYNREWRVNNGLDHYPITADFDFTYGYAFYPEWVNRSEEARLFAIQHYWNVVMDIHVVLTKR
jgi:predicted SAM-dependent methyltransferase